MSVNKLSKWFDAIICLHEDKIATCPHCGGHAIDIGYIDSSGKGDIGFGVVWCKECYHAFHISRVQLKKNLKIIPEVPKGLIF